MNIGKDLAKQRLTREKGFNANEAVKAVKLLENQDAQEDLRIAKALGDNSITRAMEEKGKMLQLERLDGKYLGNVFTIGQIEEVAKKFHLRFLPAKMYKGELPLDVIRELKGFAKDANVNISDTALEYNFKVLAPATCFRLTKKPVPVDPGLFYMIDDTHYRLVKHWGADFGVWNRVRGMVLQSTRSLVITLWVSFFMIAENILLYFWPTMPVWLSLIVLVATFFIALWVEDDALEGYTHKDTWRSEHKLD